jgi:hypothetical protein
MASSILETLGEDSTSEAHESDDTDIETMLVLQL